MNEEYIECDFCSTSVESIDGSAFCDGTLYCDLINVACNDCCGKLIYGVKDVEKKPPMSQPKSSNRGLVIAKRWEENLS